MSRTRIAIAELLAEGLTQREISARLDLASATVDYHVKRLHEPTTAPVAPAGLPSREDVISHVETRDAVRELLAAGHSKLQIAGRLGISKSTVSYHAKRLGAPVDQRGARRYDWAAIQRYYDAGRSVNECVAYFGFSKETWNSARKRGDVATRPHTMPIDELLSKRRNRNHLKARLIAAGLKDNRCEKCGIDSWMGRPLSMSLHHKNGVRDDNRLENLELLCANCHSQTENFAGRNRPKAA